MVAIGKAACFALMNSKIRKIAPVSRANPAATWVGIPNPTPIS